MIYHQLLLLSPLLENNVLSVLNLFRTTETLDDTHYIITNLRPFVELSLTLSTPYKPLIFVQYLSTVTDRPRYGPILFFFVKNP